MNWYSKMLKKAKWYDIGLTKIASMAFILLVAKFYPQILAADWMIYAAIFVIAAAIVLFDVHRK